MLIRSKKDSEPKAIKTKKKWSTFEKHRNAFFALWQQNEDMSHHEAFEHFCIQDANFATAWWLTVLHCFIGVESSVLDFADVYKVDGPTESCEVPESTEQESCAIKVLPSIHPYSSSVSCGSTGAYPNCYRVKGGLHWNKVTLHLHMCVSHRNFVKTFSPTLRSAAAKITLAWTISSKPVRVTCAAMRQIKTPSSAKLSLSTPGSVPMQVEHPSNGEMRNFVVSPLR